MDVSRPKESWRVVRRQGVSSGRKPSSSVALIPALSSAGSSDQMGGPAVCLDEVYACCRALEVVAVGRTEGGLELTLEFERKPELFRRSVAAQQPCFRASLFLSWFPSVMLARTIPALRNVSATACMRV